MPTRFGQHRHSISGPELDALLAAGTATRHPTYAPAPSPGSINAYVARVANGRTAAVLATAGVLLLVVALAVRGVASREQGAQSEPQAVAASVISAPSAATETPAQIYAAAPTMTVWCDGKRRELVSASQMAPARRAGCIAAYGWCVACQIAWQQAH